MNIHDLSLESLLESDVPDSGLQWTQRTAETHSDGIAIIGISAQIGRCEDLASFWQLLSEGRSAHRSIPAAREADVQEYLRLKGQGGRFSREDFLFQSYLPEIDKFDHAFFGLSRQEANFMDPHQRLFLQTAWAALEDAGHGGDSVRGSLTGMYVGFSSDFGEDYRRIIQTLSPDAPEISVAGNIKSIIGSRLAFHLDLRGPSLLVDTACSSGLTALHLACQGLKQGDCTMAIAGAVKLDLIPIQAPAEGGLGTKDIEETIASDGRTKTFDENCDGTSGAEGVLAFVLKPLARAKEDRDHIYAVIRSTAMNQDGLSVGITAPNSAAQEALILRALATAGISAESISYLEAHGTATRLGDPIEISGIQRAFSHHTTRQQFCAIGSTKTNLGHLDNAAGLAGLAKVVLALQHRELPASLNFQTPNPQIGFVRSPVFVNDRRRAWDVPAGMPRRAGINSFGLSGTNTHAILEEYYETENRPAPAGPFLLPVSARTENGLRSLAQRYRDRISDPSFNARPDDVSFTAATGRRHLENRLVVLFRTVPELDAALAEFLRMGEGEKRKNSWWSGGFRLVETVKGLHPGELTESSQAALTRRAEALRASAFPNHEARLIELAQLYVAGASVAWSEWFGDQHPHRISLPTYPFARERCWVATTAQGEALAFAAKPIPSLPPVARLHPLLFQCLANTEGLRLYTATLKSDSHWELADHQIRGVSVLPGTCYLEMISAAIRDLQGGSLVPTRFEEIQFLHPFTVENGEPREVHLQLRPESNGYSVRILSRNPADKQVWVPHAEARISGHPVAAPAAPQTNLFRECQARLSHPLRFAQQDDLSRGLNIGDRWNKCFVEGWRNADATEACLHLRLPDAYEFEGSTYILHPALLDAAVNALNHTLKEGQLYLPFSYESFEVHRPLPSDFIAHLRRANAEAGELVQLDLELYDVVGNLCVTAHGYRVKRVSPLEQFGERSAASIGFHALEWIPDTEASVISMSTPQPRRLLVLRRLDKEHVDAVHFLRAQGCEVKEIVMDTEDLSSPALRDSLMEFANQEWSGAVYLAGLPLGGTDGESEVCLVSLNQFMAFIQALLHQRIRFLGPLLVATRQGQVTTSEGAATQASADAVVPSFAPEQAALGAFARIVGLENQQLNLRVVDVGESSLNHALLSELQQVDKNSLSVHRGASVGSRAQRLIPRIQTLNTRVPVPVLELDREGVCVITGGTGALGLELAISLAQRQPQRRLVLIGHQPVAEKSEWARLAADPDRRTAHRYQRLLSLAQSARLDIHAVDVADRTALGSLLENIRKNVGPIRGVVHAAGRAGEGFVISKSSEALRKVVEPKVVGAWNLHELTRQDSLEFFVLYSSIATVLQNPGQSDYTAANAYLDALAHHRRSLSLPAISINWPAWSEVGIAVDYGAVDDSEFFAPISTSAALEGFHRALAFQNDLPAAVVIGALNPRFTQADVARLGIAVAPEVLRQFKTKPTTPPNSEVLKPLQGLPEVSLRGLDTVDEFDRLAAQIWSETLALTDLEVDVSFSDLGGNSILITQMYKSYQKHHPGVMDMADLFSLTTIREQAEHLRKRLRVSPTQSTDSILERLARGELSVEDAEKYL